MAETLDNLDDALFGDFEDYLAGTLPEARRREVDARLKASPEARALLAEFTEAQTLFQKPVWDVPEPVALPSAQAILDRAKSRPTARKSFPAMLKDWFGVATWRPALASGFAIALLASGTWLVLRSNQSQKTESVAQDKSKQDPAGNTPLFKSTQPAAAAPATNGQPGLTADSQTPKSPAATGNANSTPERFGDLSKTGTPGTMGDSPAEQPKSEPAKITSEKTVPADSDGVVATGRADADKGTTDNKPSPEPAAKPAAPGTVAGGVPAQPSPPPPPRSQPEPVVKTPTVEERTAATGGESTDDSSPSRDEKERAASLKRKKVDSRAGPGSAGTGPNNRNQQRANDNLAARARVPAQSVGLNVSDRDKAVGQLKGIAAQFGGTIAVNGSSIEIVVPGDRVGACAAKVRALNAAPSRESTGDRRKDPVGKQEPATSVHLSVTVKEKPE